ARRVAVDAEAAALRRRAAHPRGAAAAALVALREGPARLARALRIGALADAALVDLAVAVVVNLVADLRGAGMDRRVAVVAVVLRAEARVRRREAVPVVVVGQALVRLEVAVVVDAI